MQKYKLVFLLFIAIRCTFFNAYSQETNGKIPISENKVFIDGEKYYIHIVKQGETIFSLCKAYNISQNVLEQNNPEIINGLKENVSLKIPIIDRTATASEEIMEHTVKQGETVYSIAKLYNIGVNTIYENNPEAEENIFPGQKLKIIKSLYLSYNRIEEDEDNIYHRVEIGETAYSVARRYGLKVKDIKDYNSTIDLQQLHVGQIITIPKQEIELIENQPGTYDDHFYYLKIKQQQTLYAISKRFKISIKDIKKANPELKNRELIAGETIRVPILNEFIFTEINRLKERDIEEFEEDSIQEIIILDSASYPCRNYDYRTKPGPFNIGLFLPLYGIINDTLDLSIDKKDRELRIYHRSKVFVEFYQGVLLALEELKKENILLNLHLFDTNNDTLLTSQIVESEKFKKLDLIIGPVYANNIELVAKKAKENKISLVSPLLNYNDFIQDNLYAFQVNPTSEIKRDYWLNMILSQKLENIIIIHDGNNFERDFSKKFKSRYFKSIVNRIEENNVFYKEHLYFNSEDTLIRESMIKGLKNTIIIPSTDQAYVSDIMSKLNTLAKEFDITVYGMDVWVKYSNIELEYFHNLNTHLFANSFIDYNDYNVNQFIREYRKYFHAEPGKFSFQAYDITYYFVKALQMFGKEFRFCLEDFNPELLETNFRFKRYNYTDGFINNLLFTIVYQPDYTRKVIY